MPLLYRMWLYSRLKTHLHDILLLHKVLAECSWITGFVRGHSHLRISVLERFLWHQGWSKSLRGTSAFAVWPSLLTGHGNGKSMKQPEKAMRHNMKTFRLSGRLRSGPGSLWQDHSAVDSESCRCAGSQVSSTEVIGPFAKVLQYVLFGHLKFSMKKESHIFMHFRWWSDDVPILKSHGFSMDFPGFSQGFSQFHLSILEPNTPLRPRGISWIPWKHSWQTPGTRCPGFGQLDFL